MIKVLVDTHTHTNCSTHAHSTLLENAYAAKERGLEMLCMTNHAPAIPDSPHIWHFETMGSLPKEIKGVKMAYGAEANLLDLEGNIDLPEDVQKKMDLIVASIHSPCLAPETSDDYTTTYLGAIKNPYITILGHSGSVNYPYDIDAVVKAAKEYNKCIEINNHTFTVRRPSIENCRKIALACKKYQTNIAVSSDAHNSFDIGNFDNAIKMLTDIDFPEELIVNATAQRFTEYLSSLKK